MDYSPLPLDQITRPRAMLKPQRQMFLIPKRLAMMTNQCPPPLPYFATAALSTCVRKKPPLVLSMTC